MAKIDRVQDLPNWFDLKNYKDCKSFTAFQWLHQLQRRHDLLALHPSRVKIANPNASDSFMKFAYDFWRIAVREPAIEVRHEPTKGVSDEIARSFVSDIYSQPIKHITASDLIGQSERDLKAELNNQVEPGFSKRWGAIASNPLNETLSNGDGSPLSINYHDKMGSRPIVEVDLGAPDAVLKEAFSSWLAEQRRNATPPSKPLFDRWARYGVLPYIDLLIWEMEAETHVPDRVMSAAISEFDVGEANLRKTIAPLAERLMQSLNELQVQCAVEARALLKRTGNIHLLKTSGITAPT